MQFSRALLFILIILAPTQILPGGGSRFLWDLKNMCNSAQTYLSPYFKKCSKKDYALMTAAGIGLVTSACLWYKNNTLHNKTAAHNELAQIGKNLDCLHTKYFGIMTSSAQYWSEAYGKYDYFYSRIRAAVKRQDSRLSDLANDIAYLEKLRDHCRAILGREKSDWPVDALYQQRLMLLNLINETLSSLETIKSHLPAVKLVSKSEDLIHDISKRYDQEFTQVWPFDAITDEKQQALYKCIELRTLKMGGLEIYCNQIKTDQQAIKSNKKELESALVSWKKMPNPACPALIHIAESTISMFSTQETSLEIILAQLNFIMRIST